MVAHAAVFTANSPSDVVDANPGDGICETGAGNGICTLRAAIEETNTLQGADQINLPADIYLLTINNALFIADSVTIIGSGASSTIIDGNKSVRHLGVLQIPGSSTVSISGVTIVNGEGFNGGGISSRGTLTVIDSTVSGNSAERGGGIFIEAGTMMLTNSTVSGNTVIKLGGGIYNNEGEMTLINSTVSGNSAFLGGGGIFNEATVNSFNSTITNNIADPLSGSGGGIYNETNGSFSLFNTILAKNLLFLTLFPNPISVASDCFGTITSNGNNVISTLDMCTVNGGGATVADPKIGPLQNNGGPTQTHALLAGSPAIDGGNPTGCRDNLGALLLTDQRRATRHFDGDGNGSAICDIGAVEFGSPVGVFTDFDGDGNTDIAVYQTSTGNWFWVGSTSGFDSHLAFGGTNFIPVPADYDSDGVTDTAVYDTTNGNWFIAQTTAGFTVHPSFGGPGFIRVPGDYDGDAKVDIAVYETSSGNWFYVGSISGFGSHIAFGGTNFIPVQADYDGIGVTDTAVYDKTNGNWFISQTMDGFVVHPSFGGAGFIPFPGDYDGDGKTDIAVYETSSGNWFYVGSTSGFGSHIAFGRSDFTPVPGDYDGDGTTDTAVYDTTNGNWFIAQTTAGFVVHPSFGGPGYMPVLPPVTILRAMGLL